MIRRVLRFASSFFSLENAFVLFLLSGRFKADPRFSWFPIDITLFFMGISILAFIYIYIRNANKISLGTVAIVAILIYFAFLHWSVLSMLWAQYTGYTLQKAIRLIGPVTISFLIPLLAISRENTRLIRFLSLWILYSLWIASEAWITYLNGNNMQLLTHEVLGGNYLGVGRVVGFSAISALGLLFLTDRGINKLVRVMLIASLGFFLLTLLVVGARGPFVATVISILVMLLIILFVYYKKFAQYVFYIAVLSVLFGLLLPHIPAVTLKRLDVLFTESGGVSVEGRLSRYSFSINLASSNPFLGSGLSSFYYYYKDSAEKDRDYPHNIFLEIFSELGVIGLILFIMLLTLPFLNFYSRKLRYDQQLLRFIIMALYFFDFINSQVSGDLSDNRTLFSSIGLLLGYNSSRCLQSSPTDYKRREYKHAKRL